MLLIWSFVSCQWYEISHANLYTYKPVTLSLNITFWVVQGMLDTEDIKFSLADIKFLRYLSLIPTRTCNS